MLLTEPDAEGRSALKSWRAIHQLSFKLISPGSAGSEERYRLDEILSISLLL